MRVAFLTNYDSTDVRNWSGLGYYLAKSLEQQGIQLIRIDCSVKFSLAQRIRRRLIRLCWRKIQQPERDNSYLQKMADKASRLLAGRQYDLIFAAGSLPVSFLRSDKPIAFYTDATYDGLMRLYADKDKLWPQSLLEGNKAEEKAIHNADLIFYTSEWARKSAVTGYKANPAKIRQLGFGPNLESALSPADMQMLINRRKKARQKNFLFLGVDWDRKGAAIAIETIARLNDLGMPATITMAGFRVPPGISLPPFVIYYPFISKDKPAGVRQLRSLYENAAFFLLPTLADCTPVVFSEAASYGLPVITTDVGGCPSVVIDKVTGYCLSKKEFVEEVAKRIATLWHDEELYEAFCWQAFDHYKNDLNWEAIGKKAVASLQQLVKKYADVLPFPFYNN
ncbi:glycosyltransferase family 4 protein [Puia sp.]|jgi:glycosyltransferase involved in cell wall biosynthesis|uniref:glycosyltransferase family 4 protein n=1 Tax=Puia sp. TaxID=2045100 RepID=UPI002F4109AD